LNELNPYNPNKFLSKYDSQAPYSSKYSKKLFQGDPEKSMKRTDLYR
jgi:hypothetical protein